ncbi:MAG: hypothetical protein ACK5PP_05005 [Acidimicrobiales bacterium]
MGVAPEPDPVSEEGVELVDELDVDGVVVDEVEVDDDGRLLGVVDELELDDGAVVVGAADVDGVT